MSRPPGPGPLPECGRRPDHVNNNVVSDDVTRHSAREVVSPEHGSHDNQIGSNNIITRNAIGVSVGATANTIMRNSILSPTSKSNPNDAGDTDNGTNEQLNFPVLSIATTRFSRRV